jgi:IMP dehydrogenase
MDADPAAYNRSIAFWSYQNMRLLGLKRLTFDDVLLVPAYSQVLPKDTRLPPNSPATLPEPAIGVCRHGHRDRSAPGHRHCAGRRHWRRAQKHDCAAAGRQVAKVKRYESGVLRDPVVITPEHTVRQVMGCPKSWVFLASRC